MGARAVLICGGTDWPKLGKKERGGAAKVSNDDFENPDLLEPHILRSLANVAITSVHTSCNGCHFVAIDIDGAAWLFGRNLHGALGIPSGPHGDEYVSENAPMRVRPVDVGAPEGTRWVWAACGRNHTLLVGSEGSVWSAGQNNLGQCGHAICPEVTSFKLVTGFPQDEHVVKASAGVTFSIALTASGKVFSFGSGEHGQLGNGTTGERITTGNKTAFDIEVTPLYIKALDGVNIVDIASGQQHSIALDEKGVVYVWGYNGYCRLGLGNQVDALRPKAVPQFAGPEEPSMGSLIAAGPSNSVVVDRQGVYWMAGKWKNSGDGSSGSPYSSFRVMQDIMGCKITRARSGGVTHWALTPDDDDTVMTVAWGQNAANGELGLGADEPKSATKPTRSIPLVGVDVFEIAAGQNTTVLLARPNDKMSDLQRHPLEVDPPPLCVRCRKDNGDDDSPLECDKCDSPYHLGCLDTPLTAVPDGEWFCVSCKRTPGAPIGYYPKRKGNVAAPSGGAGTKRRARSPDADEDAEAGGKRKSKANDRNIFHPTLSAQKALAAGWLITAIINILWVLYLTTVEISPLGATLEPTNSEKAQAPPHSIPSVPTNIDAFVSPTAPLSVADASRTTQRESTATAAVDGHARDTRTLSGAITDTRAVSTAGTNPTEPGEPQPLAPIAQQPQPAAAGPSAPGKEEKPYPFKAEALYTCAYFYLSRDSA
ncbi:hypothetical protein DXG03_008676 [Asterophora parasitica]|uniref:PHD-type domain-containing protein n=1 Tax=Asterophora parasitica TaxID=117018 RepID=A0A9P7G687_9AGAR|nr:hypothetical protein DXG03_008676 [Asterophora parasitica]